ncbi:MAG: hypothetical protein K6G83_16405 [Lachnospiraceae bacterium]|nr:hypothetical protein [Lachnospiraceae bacterium]
MRNSAENNSKNKITYIIITIVIAVCGLCLSGCELLEDIGYAVQDISEEIVGHLRYRDEDDYEIDVVSGETPEFIITITDDEAEQSSFENAARLSGNSLTSIRVNEISNIIDGYAYAMLMDEERAIYDQIYDLLANFKTDVVLSTTDTDILDHAFTCVLIDHPEIFYVKGYSVKTYSKESVIEKISMTGTYTMTQSQAIELSKELDGYYAACLSGIPADADEYERVRDVYQYIIRHTEYDLKAPNNQNVLSVFMNHRSVCQGYAKAMQYILNRMGIFCTLVEGTVKGTEAHVWDMVRINGEYYHVDPTWGDASYRLVSDEDDRESLPPPEINYDYLCITTQEILKTHSIKEVVPVMECTSMENNYYVREGLYFTYVDDEGLHRAFDTAYENSQLTITIKCSDDKVYGDMVEYLLTNQKIFNYLANTSVSYVTVEEQEEIIFYL